MDDSSDVRQMWCLWLHSWGFSVDEACNGAEAIARARVQRPDLVLMDLWMPVMDGLEAITRLRADPSMAEVPIIASTAQDTGGMVQRAKECGATAFVAKPVMPEVLLAQIQATINRA